jgi:hypothetical protein
VVRAVELSLGILDKETEADLLKYPGFRNIRSDGDLKASFQELLTNHNISKEVRIAVHSASRILTDLEAHPRMDTLSLKFEPLQKGGLIVK